jgi:hypothetical protein
VIRFIGIAHVWGITVSVGIDGYRANTQLVTGAQNAHGNFATVGNKHFSESSRV